MSDSAAPDALSLTRLIAAGDIDVIAGHPPIPIAVWRVADAGHAHNNLADGLTPRMAAMLVASYTRPGDTIISLGTDPALQGAAGAGGRTYLSVDEPADLADLDHVAGTVRLIVLPWPPARRAQPITATEAVDMFTTCRHLMARNGCTIVALTALPSGDGSADTAAASSLQPTRPGSAGSNTSLPSPHPWLSPPSPGGTHQAGHMSQARQPTPRSRWTY